MEGSNPAPNTLEGYFVLHQFFRVRRLQLKALEAERRTVILGEAAGALIEMGANEDGDSAVFTQLGHKGDLISDPLSPQSGRAGRGGTHDCRL